MSYKIIVAKRCAFRSVILWTYGESNPDLVHAMDAFYRYTIGPLRRILTKKVLDVAIMLE